MKNTLIKSVLISMFVVVPAFVSLAETQAGLSLDTAVSFDCVSDGLDGIEKEQQ